MELYQFVSGSFKHYSQIQRSAHQSSAETREYPFVCSGNEKRFEYNWNVIIIPALQIYLKFKIYNGLFFPVIYELQVCKASF